MSKKLTYEFVKKSFENEGYTLLSKEYVNNSTKLNYICPKGHKYSIDWNKWSLGRRCPFCNPKGRVRNVSIDFIRDELNKEGYTLLSKEYVNSYTKLEYICPNGHIYSTSWDAWKSKNSRCAYCSNNAKLTTDFVSTYLKTKGFILLSEYFNAITKLYVVCDKGHLSFISWASLSQGIGCAVCSNKKKHSTEYIRTVFEANGYTLLTKKYVNTETKLEYICPYGHIHSIKWNNFEQGQRCPTCYVLNNFGENTPNWKGGKSLEEYCEVWKDKEYKQDIRERDGNRCLNPDCWEKDKILSVHHIDYDKKNCKPSNLITVCRSCNSRANKDRRWHKAWYQAILHNRYGYSY